MANRLLKDGICTSDLINNLSNGSEVLFYRLLVVADDYGRMDGRVQIVKSQCFPLKESFTTLIIEELLEELENNDLISFYSVEGKPFFYIKKWEQRQRNKEKYPSPDLADCEKVQQPAADCQQPAKDSGLGLGLGKGKGKGEDKEKDKKEKPEDSLPKQNLVSDEIWDSFLQIRKKAKAINSPQAIKCLITELEKLKAQGHDPTEVVNQSIRSSWKDVYPLKNSINGNGKTEKFDPVAYVNRNRIRDDDEQDHRIIDI
jgi:hypothetical protein